MDNPYPLEAVVEPPAGDGEWWGRYIYLHPGGAHPRTLAPDARLVIFPYGRRNGKIQARSLTLFGVIKYEELTPEQLGAILSGEARP